MSKLYRNMSVEEFEKGYFYATELKSFAKELGIDVGTLRKNEVEDHIKARLSGSKDTPLPKSVSNRKTGGSRDRLSPDSYVVNYVSDKATNNQLNNCWPYLKPGGSLIFLECLWTFLRLFPNPLRAPALRQPSLECLRFSMKVRLRAL